jgi:Icc-related predicted phosphoesterase
MIPIGSTAVRDAIERHQPLVGLHGHVHESPAAQQIGRTQCINPGSEYVDGIVRGVLVTLFGEGKVQWQMVQG